MKHRGGFRAGAPGVAALLPQILATRGPIVKLHVMPPAALRGAPLVAVDTRLMVDTGAELTVIDDWIPDHLGLVPVEYKMIAGAIGPPKRCPVYRLAFTIGFGPTGEEAVPAPMIANIEGNVVGLSDHHEDCEGLLGRDLLKYFRFTYNGHLGNFTLEPMNLARPPASGLRARVDARKRRKQASRAAAPDGTL